MIAHRQRRAMLKRCVAMLLTMGSYNRDALTMNPIASTTAGNAARWVPDRDANVPKVVRAMRCLRMQHPMPSVLRAGILVTHR
jgi:hypothetical protein